MAVAPPHRQYDYLVVGLARYRAIQRNGGWPIIGGAATGALAASDARLPVLSRRLAIEGFLSTTVSQRPSLDDIVAGLKRFQAASGLEQTGTLGKRTFAALNVPVEQRISQIIANLERWRWMPSFKEAYVEANAASAMLTAVKNGAVELSSRIIAGKPQTPTPIFMAEITGISINPYWNVPVSIAKNEILPKERRSPGYLDSQGMAFDGPDGSLRQKPGPNNALGRIKLEMPNTFNAYLHDTPQRTLFRSDDRHLSHGCMRVQDIVPLASWVLRGNALAGVADMEARIASGQSARISLDMRVPVYVVYWTAIADKDGSVGFRPDVYGRDKRLLAALAGQRQAGNASNSYCQANAAG